MTTVVVLDSEAVSLLSPARRHDPRRRRLMALIEEADELVVPVAARVEALAPRDAHHVHLNRLTQDAEVTPRLRPHVTRVANLAARARADLGTQVAVVDALVAATATVSSQQAGSHVEIATSDVGDLGRLVAHLEAPVDVVGL